MARKTTTTNQGDCFGNETSMTRRDLLALLGIVGLAAPTDVAAQDAGKVNPRSYAVLLENEKVRVLEFRSRPGFGVCGQGKHSHPAHLTIVLSEGKVKVVTGDGKVHVREAKAGDLFWAQAETHSVENTSGRNMRAYMVEIKDKDWKASTG